MKERAIASRRAFAGHLISVRVDSVELSGGRVAEREIVEHPGAVAILAWDGARLAMVRQWRHPTGGFLLEIPAGTREPDEPARATAERELGEECGLAGGGWLRGPSFFTAPGFCTERLDLFLATDLRQVDITGPDDEEVTASWLSLDEALAAVDDGRIIDAKSLCGILWLARRLGVGGATA